MSVSDLRTRFRCVRATARKHADLMTKRLPQDHSRIKRDVSLEARASGLNLHHMLDLADHAAHIGRVLKFHRAVHLVEPETDQGRALVLGAADRRRSEEHTSELQSLMRISYAVFCL